MKIALNMGNSEGQSSRAAQTRVLERDIAAAKKGDWNAKNNLARTFMPLLTSLAEKRSKELRAINEYIEAGKEGVFKAARKFDLSEGGERFNIFVVEYVGDAMDRRDKGAGFWARLFGR
jgi:DNA-directed RNA polymerase specialized sigma subunit